MTCYFKLGDYSRITKYYRQELHPEIQKLILRTDLTHDIQNYILHVDSIYADSLMLVG